MAIELGLPVFVVFDADGDTVRADHRIKHEKDNRALMSLLGIADDPFPMAHVVGANHVIWQTSLTKAVKSDFLEADYTRLTEVARQHYAQEGGLEKNHLYIAEWLTAANNETLTSPTLNSLCRTILDFAGREV